MGASGGLSRERGFLGIGRVDARTSRAKNRAGVARPQVVCEQIASAHDDLAGELLGYEIVTIEGKNNKFLAQCNIDA